MDVLEPEPQDSRNYIIPPEVLRPLWHSVSPSLSLHTPLLVVYILPFSPLSLSCLSLSLSTYSPSLLSPLSLSLSLFCLSLSLSTYSPSLFLSLCLSLSLSLCLSLSLTHTQTQLPPVMFVIKTGFTTDVIQSQRLKG